MAAQQPQYARALIAHRDEIAERWTEVIAPMAKAEREAVEAQLADLTDQVIGLLTTDCFECREAQAIGETLALRVSSAANTLGRTQQVLAQVLIEKLPDGQAVELQPHLIQLLSELAVGFVQVRERDELVASVRRRFLSSTVHGMRSPLNAIIGFSRIILKGIDGPITDIQRQDLQTVYDGGRDLLDYINDLFKPERMAAGEVQCEVQPCALGDVIDEAAASVQQTLDANDDTLSVRYANEPGQMHTDPEMVKQMLGSLLGHAAKSTKQGTIELAVSREKDDAGEWIEFRITDTGLGLTPEQVEAFEQGSDPASPRYSDVQLALGQRYCQVLGGDIELESKVNEGATFTIRLPASHPGFEGP